MSTNGSIAIENLLTYIIRSEINPSLVVTSNRTIRLHVTIDDECYVIGLCLPFPDSDFSHAWIERGVIRAETTFYPVDKSFYNHFIRLHENEVLEKDKIQQKADMDLFEEISTKLKRIECTPKNTPTTTSS